MSTLANYEGLLALSTSPHLSQAMREYLVGVLSEHREMRAALSACAAGIAALEGAPIEYRLALDLSICLNSARTALAKVNA